MRRPPIELQRVEHGHVRLLLDVGLFIRVALALPWMLALFAFWLGMGIVTLDWLTDL